MRAGEVSKVGGMRDICNSINIKHFQLKNKEKVGQYHPDMSCDGIQALLA